jgi:hypothetical protein
MLCGGSCILIVSDTPLKIVIVVIFILINYIRKLFIKSKVNVLVHHLFIRNQKIPKSQSLCGLLRINDLIIIFIHPF